MIGMRAYELNVVSDAHHMHMDGFMPTPIDRDGGRDWQVLLSVQDGIVSRQQALHSGLSRRQIARRLQSGKWQRVHPGVYATFSGTLPPDARLWAAVRWAGRGALLSHETAAGIHGLVDISPRGSIHVTVPLERHPAKRAPRRGIIVHRSDQSKPQFHSPFKLPCTRIEDTVLDLAAAAPTFDHAYAWVARAVSRKLVTVSVLRAALDGRGRIRWREWLTQALEEDLQEGVYSSLERRYVRDVELAHGLPRSRHQERREFGGRAHYRDNWYADCRVVVEIDGPAYHQNERVQLDKDRDNRNLAADGVQTLRFGPVGVTERACASAALVAATLQRNGWQGAPHPCRRPGCPVGRAFPPRPITRQRSSYPAAAKMLGR